MSHDPRPYEHHRIEWRGMLIELRYCADICAGFAALYGHAMAHLEVETIEPVRAALPITETGYRSHFAAEPEVSAAGGPVDYLLDALERAADDPDWKLRESAARQYSLF